MKIYNKLIALVAAFGLVGVSYAQDEAAGGNLTDNISIAGFVDASYSNSESGATDTETIGVDEVEIDFLFGFGSVNSEVHLDSTGTGTVGVEQAWVSYDVNPSLTVTVGRYGSALGFEREDPAGLYTVSRAYDDGGLNLGNVNANAVEGLAFSYTASDTLSGRISFEDSSDQNIDGDKVNVEISVAYTGIDNLSLGGGYRMGNGPSSLISGGVETIDGGDTHDIVTVNATYTAGKALIGAEYIDADAAGTASDVDAFMVLLDYDVSEKLGLVLRYSDEDSGTNTADADKFTIAPNYAITDDLGAILEYSDGKVGTTDNDTLALELTLTF